MCISMGPCDSLQTSNANRNLMRITINILVLPEKINKYPSCLQWKKKKKTSQRLQQVLCRGNRWKPSRFLASTTLCPILPDTNTMRITHIMEITKMPNGSLTSHKDLFRNHGMESRWLRARVELADGGEGVRLEPTKGMSLDALPRALEISIRGTD